MNLDVGGIGFKSIDLPNNKKVSAVSFGKSETEDSFQKQNTGKETGIFDKIKQNAGKLKDNIKEKFLNAYLYILQRGYRDKESLEYIDKIRTEFIKTPEGIRRAAMSEEEIEREFKNAFDKSFDKLEVPKDLRPKLVLNSKNDITAGGYQQLTHTIEVNTNSYRTFPEEDSIIMHEATHAKEALLRASIPQNKVDEIVKNELKSNDKTLHILNPAFLTFVGFPKMSQAMKNDFNMFADKNLFNKSENVTKVLAGYDFQSSIYQNILPPKYFVPYVKNLSKFIYKDIKPIYDGIDTLIQNHPEFLNQYKNKEEAFNELMKCSFALNTEYNLFTQVHVGGDLGTNQVKVKELSEKELEQAKKSLINSMATKRSNIMFSKNNNTFTKNMYKFCPEEVLAETNGRRFLIKNCTDKLIKNKLNGTLQKEQETLLKLQIEFAKGIIEYRTKGAELFDKMNELAANPEDKELKKYLDEKGAELEKMLDNLKKMEQKISSYNKQ